MNNQTTCNPQRIELFLRQQLSDEEQTAFELHLDDCNDCRHRLEATAAGDDVWSGVRDSLLGQELAPDCLRSGDPTLDPGLDSATGGDASFSHDTVLKMLAPTDDDRMIGRLGTYEVVGVIGSGGMGVVLKALDGALNRYVAIKVLAPHLGSSGSARKRFSREAQAAAAVVHENVMEIHGVADANGLPYLVMPYVRGPSLQRRLDDDGPLALVEILRIAVQAASGLAAAHAQGLVHRDVKPANILLADGVERVKLTDFGLARAADDASLTRTGIIAGTPQYMSPEQSRGESVDQRSDLFSLGSVLYAMCTGRAPFRAETSYGVLRRITDEEPQSIREINPDIPQWLCQIIAKLMSKQPDDRHESAREVAELLEECLAHVQQPTAVPLPHGRFSLREERVSFADRTMTRFRRSPRFTLLTGAAFALAMIFAGILIVLELNKGKLTIECEADAVPVRIMQGDKVVEKLTITRGGASVRISAGKYIVAIDGQTDGLTVENGTVNLQRGGREVVKIVREITEPDVAAPGRDTLELETLVPPGPTQRWNDFKAELERTEQLFRRGYVSKRQFEAAKLEVQRAKAAARAAREQENVPGTVDLPLWNEFGVTPAPVSPLTAKVLEWIGLHLSPIRRDRFRDKHVFAKYPGGLDVTFVRSHGPAEKAGIHEVDIVVRLQGRPIASLQDLDFAMQDAVEQIEREDADSLPFDVLRRGETVRVNVPFPVSQLDGRKVLDTVERLDSVLVDGVWHDVQPLRFTDADGNVEEVLVGIYPNSSPPRFRTYSNGGGRVRREWHGVYKLSNNTLTLDFQGLNVIGGSGPTGWSRIGEDQFSLRHLKGTYHRADDAEPRPKTTTAIPKRAVQSRLANAENQRGVEGSVTAVSDGHVVISIGHDDGIERGMRLIVSSHRMGRIIYRGTIEIIKLETDRSVGQIVEDSLMAPIRTGDQVTASTRTNTSAPNVDDGRQRGTR